MKRKTLDEIDEELKEIAEMMKKPDTDPQWGWKK